MEPNETILVSGRIIAEFEDDASPCLASETEVVRATETPVVVPPNAAPPANDAGQARPS